MKENFHVINFMDKELITFLVVKNMLANLRILSLMVKEKCFGLTNAITKVLNKNNNLGQFVNGLFEGWGYFID